MAQAESDDRWWICTDMLVRGGRNLALRVRTYVEKVPMADRPDQEHKPLGAQRRRSPPTLEVRA